MIYLKISQCNTMCVLFVFRVKLHVAQTFVHMFTHVVGYTLMLVVMSYNAYIGLTVALGKSLFLVHDNN